MPKLMNIVMGRLPKDGEREKAKSPETELTGMLSTLLASDIQPDAKMKILKEEYGIETSMEVKEDVTNMTSFAQEYGDYRVSAGRKPGRQETKDEVVMNMIALGKLTDEEIASVAVVSL